MVTTIRINKDLQHRLKLKSAETGMTQLQLANKYIYDGLKGSSIQGKQAKTLDEIAEILEFDEPRGNGLDKIDGLFEAESPTNSVKLKKELH